MEAYLASAYSRREEMLGYARDLEARGHYVTSTWIDGHHETRPNIDAEAGPDEMRVWAVEDTVDLVRADTLIAFTEEPGRKGRNRGGRHVEFGVALGWNVAVRKLKRPAALPLSSGAIVWPDLKRIVVIGPVENVFYSLQSVERFETWEAFLATVEDLSLSKVEVHA